VTARKPRAEPPAGDPIAEALRRQALIVEHLYDGIVVTDHDGVILDWNPAAERLFGYSRGEVIGRSAELLNRPGEGPALSRAIRAGLKTRGLWTGELAVVAKDGTERQVEAVVIDLKDEGGRPVIVLGGQRHTIPERERTPELT